MTNLEVLYLIDKRGSLEPHKLIVEANSENEGTYKALMKLGAEDILGNYRWGLDDYKYKDHFEDLDEECQQSVLNNTLDYIFDRDGYIKNGGSNILLLEITNLNTKEVIANGFYYDDVLK